MIKRVNDLDLDCLFRVRKAGENKLRGLKHTNESDSKAEHKNAVVLHMIQPTWNGFPKCARDTNKSKV